MDYFSFIVDNYIYVIIFSFSLLYFYVSRNLGYWKKRGVKGPTPLPFIGNLFENYMKAVNVVEEERFLKYGRVYGTLNGTQPVLTISDPDLIKQIGIRDFHIFRNRNPMFPGHPLLSQMLEELEDDKWRAVRSIASPAFTSAKIKQMVPLVEKCVDNTIQYLKEESKVSNINTKKVMLAFAMDVFAKCCFGVDTNGFEDPNSVFLRNAYELMNVNFIDVLLTKVLPLRIQQQFNIQLSAEKMIKYFENTVKEVIKERRKANVTQVDFVKLLLDADLNNENDKKIAEENSSNEAQTTRRITKTKLTETEIVAQAISFMTAGYESTSTLADYFFYVMALNPDVQNKLYEEIHEYFLRNNGVTNYEDLMSLPYLDAAVNETLRLFAPTINFDRVAAKDYPLGIDGIVIPKGTIVSISMYSVHHDPDFFPEPHRFKLERFLPENKNSVYPYSFIPFGVGPRNCIGMKFASLNSRLLIAKVIHNFEIMKTEETPEKPKFNSRFLLLRCEPLIVKFKRRS